ncbi:MAG: bifunctional UDP-N-acetylglucosamine diphosphorylase/glucosamine-1-phosphate N-acetyltransferase GlmU [Beutenbergiaceae bacterium]
MTSPTAVIVLAAGAGTRMKSATAKVLHRIGGRSLLGHALRTARELDPDHLVAVVRHEREQVAAHVAELDADALIADQDDIPGTGRAVQCALAALDAVADAPVTGPVVVTAGDVPLLDSATLAALVEAHLAEGNAVTALTTVVADPTGYGRIVRDEHGQVQAIVEQKDATAQQREITEINASIYVFDAEALRVGLASVGRANAQGEVYLTDVLALAREAGQRVSALIAEDSILVEGVNDRSQLAALGAELNRRIVHQWMVDGVTIIDPATTWIDVDVQLAPDVTLLPGTQLHGSTIVETGAAIGPDTTLTNVHVGAGATVTRTHGSDARLGPDTTVGPFALLRPGADLGDGSKIGTFVEVKNSRIGTGSKVPHLSYIGDATIGEHTNVGAASVTVNYDGVNKHATVIGSHARTGADNMFVAPVRVGDGAYTGAGSVIRRDVPPGALAVSQSSQRNLEDWVARSRPGTAAAQAAQAAQNQDESTDGADQ